MLVKGAHFSTKFVTSKVDKLLKHHYLKWVSL